MTQMTANTPSFKWKHHYAIVNKIKLHYVSAGSGEPLVLLHGFPEFWYAWRHQIPVLAEHFHVIVPDLRGYGESEKLPHIADYQMSEMAQDIIELIHHLGYKKAHIVGHDWGGAIAWHLSIEHPEIVDYLSILNCPHPAVLAKALKSNVEQMRKSWYIIFFQIPYLPELLFKLFDTTLIKMVFRGSAIRKNTFSDEDLKTYLSSIRQPGAFTAALNYYRASFRQLLKNKKTGEKIKKIKAPTLIIWGEKDSALGKELTLNLERFFEGPFQIRYIPDCSHWVNEEYPELVNQLLIQHMKQIQPSSINS